MKKWALTLLCVCLSVVVSAGKLPDNPFFRAMKDEMTRTLKGVKRPGVPRPFYVAYKMEHTRQRAAAAGLGKLYPTAQESGQIDLFVVLDIGSAKQDSLGYANEAYYYEYAYAPRMFAAAGDTYEALRQALWETSDEAYTFAAETYQQKQAYKRRKNMPLDVPDFKPGKQGSYVEEIPSFAFGDPTALETRVRQLSALGTQAAYLEQFKVKISPVQKDIYYLNNRGGFYQVSHRAVYVEWQAQLRNKDGYKKTLTKRTFLTHLDEQTQAQLEEETRTFLQELDGVYHAQKATTYVGPVLLRPAAAGGFMRAMFVKNVEHITPLLSGKVEQDPTAGKLRDKLNLRVLSNVVEITDRPLEREFNGQPLGGFMPVDDEGVGAQTLTLVSGGKLRALPRSGRPVSKADTSNGRARLTDRSLPREMLTNVFVTAKNPVPADELEKQFVEKCRALELEYCYILPQFAPMSQNKTEVAVAQRIYSADGRKEPVYGLKISDLTPRALRDILAAGDDAAVTYVQPLAYGGNFLPMQSIVTPSLLLEELELVPDDKKADKPPFVKKP